MIVPPSDACCQAVRLAPEEREGCFHANACQRRLDLGTRLAVIKHDVKLQQDTVTAVTADELETARAVHVSASAILLRVHAWLDTMSTAICASLHFPGQSRRVRAAGCAPPASSWPSATV
jgi:hypothetical protein